MVEQTLYESFWSRWSIRAVWRSLCEYVTHLGLMGVVLTFVWVGGIIGATNDIGVGDSTRWQTKHWWYLAGECFVLSNFLAFHKMRLERDLLRPRPLDHLWELKRRGNSKDWMAPDNLKFYPGGPEEWVKEDNDWSSEMERELSAVAGEKYVRRLKAVKFDESTTPYWGGLTDEQQDRWRLRHARLVELVAIIRELEDKQ